MLILQKIATIQHLLNGCEALTSILYRHNMVDRVAGTSVLSYPLGATSWHDHQPLSVAENDEVKLLWVYKNDY